MANPGTFQRRVATRLLKSSVFVVALGGFLAASCSSAPADTSASENSNSLGGLTAVPSAADVAKPTAAPRPSEAPKSPTMSSVEPLSTGTPTNAPEPTAPAGALVVNVNSPVSPGGKATATVVAAPGASCSISYRTPAGTDSAAGGLVAKTADAAGNVSWSWTIGTSTRAGTGTVAVRCGSQAGTAPIVIS